MLLDLSGIVFEEHPQRKPLASTNRGAFCIDAAGALPVEESAGTLRMRRLVRKQGRMKIADELRLNRRNRQVVQTTSGAAATTSQPLRMFVR